MHSLLNHTYTAMGARLLRVNILAPITGQSRSRESMLIGLKSSYMLPVKSALEARLDVVEGTLIQLLVYKSPI